MRKFFSSSRTAKISFLAFVFLLVSKTAMAQFPAPYCAEAFASGVEPITNVTFAGINNTTPAAIGGPAHQNFTAIVGNVVLGQSYPISVQGNTDGNFTTHVRVFIDFNNNGVFTDAGETFTVGTIVNSTGTDGKVATSTIAIPLTSNIGQIRMRVHKRFSVAGTPCNTTGFGEAEDYTLNIVAPTPCAGAPATGTASAVPLNACVGDPINLSLAGATIAGGITYQWQRSTDNVNFTNIVGATNITTSTTQTVTSYYRCVTTCSNSSTSSTSNVITVTSPLLIGGTYTINKTVPTGGTNFNSFNDAYNAIKCGINAPVIFNVVAGTGPYTEQLIIDRIIGGSSDINTITFNGNGNTINFNSTNTNERAVIKLKGTNWFRFDNLTVDASAGTFGFGFHLMNDADSNIIRNCNIIANATATTANFAGIVISGSNTDAVGTGTTLCDFNIIENNVINGGFYGVTMAATFAGGANGFNTIKRNSIQNFYQTGVYVAASYNTLIDSNTISRPTRATVTDFNGIFFTAQSNTATISRNTIRNPFGGALTSTSPFNGIVFNSASASSGNDNFVINNLVANLNGNGAQNAFLNTGSSNIIIAHNTFSLDDASSTSTATTRGYSQTGTSASILYYNNLTTIGRGGTGTKHCVNVTSAITFADNNIYFINAPVGSNHIGFLTTNRTTLANWKTANPGNEIFSLSINPIYTDPALGNFAPANAAVDNKGTYVGVDFDILGTSRSLSTPDIGAFEFVPPPCTIPPVSGITLVSIGTICQNQPVNLSLNIGAFGSGQSFQWQYATNPAGPYTNLSTAPSPNYDTTILSTQTYYYRCAIRCLSSTVFTNEVLLTVNPAMPSGNYTINNTLPASYVKGVPGGNFVSFNAAVAEMQACGVVGTGNLIFDVAQGPYNEQLIIDSIIGVNVSRQVIFKGNGRTIAFSSSTSAQRAVIKLRGADFITFDSLNIDATGAGSTAYGVQLISNADSNTVRNCIINVNSTSTTQSFGGIVVNATDAGIIATGNTLCDGNWFDRNTINGGWAGITLVGNTTAAGFIANNRITRNRILDFYNNGIYVGGATNTLIDSNFISRPTRAVVTVGNGIQLNGNSSNVRITRNRINRLFGGAPTNTSGFFGINITNCDATTGNETIVANNAIYNTDGAGQIGGIFNSGSDNVRCYHNTISIDNPNSTSTSPGIGFYQTNLATGLDFKNNIITITRGGTGGKHCMYMNTATTELTSNWNNFFINAGGTNNHIGFLTSNRTTLAAWTAAGGNRDSLSLQFDPLYVDSANGNLQPQMFPLDNKGRNNTGILNDINGAVRNSITPDMGAWEFISPNCALPLLAGTASVTPNSGACLEIPVRLTLAGNSPVGSISFQWQHATSAAGPWSNVGPLLYSPTLDTVSTTNNFYRCVVSCLTGPGTSISTVTSVALNPIMAAGTYTINPGLPLTYPGPPGSNFQTMQQAVNALLCGITGSIVFNVDGIFTEQIRIPNIPGTSASRTVTFQSASGSPSNALLRFNPTNAAQNYVLSLDSCKYVTFKTMTFINQSTTIGRVINFGLGANNDSLVNCTVNGVITNSTANTFANVYIQNTTATANINNIVVRNNTVNNGSIGIWYSGFSAAALASSTNIIEGNTLNNQFASGIQAQFVKGLIVRNNTVHLSSSLGANGNGIYTDFADSASIISNNTININGTTAAVTGLFIRNSRAGALNPTIIRSNRVVAGGGNTSTIFGINIANCNGVDVINNTSTLNSGGTNAFALQILNNGANVKVLNNSLQVSATSTTAYAGFFSNTTAGTIVNNNIFSNIGGGPSLFVNNPGLYTADYNMLFTTGATLTRVSTPANTNYANLQAWQSAWNWDASSLVYRPSFVSNNDLRPNVSDPNSWAMNGRGLQTKGNNYDFNNTYRPDSLTAGVPDFGAYEFYPTVAPIVLTAIPATPAPNTQQTFMLGTDTVMKIRWAASVPPSIEVRRFSGDVPRGLLQPRPDSMFFYTKVDMPVPANFGYEADLFYVESFLGSIPNQALLGMGRTTPSNAWVVGFNSTIDVAKRKISQNNIAYLDRFTGLVNISATPIPEDSTSNRGKDFWVGYQRSNGFSEGNGQDMVLYFGTGATAATVTVEIVGTSGTPWVRTYTVPPNSAIASDFIPKTGVDDARLVNDGIYPKKGIHITSNVPIVAYAHIFQSTNSGATMLLPTAVWGYEHYVLTSRQNYTSTSYSAFHIVAQEDSTWIEVNPSANTQGGWTPNGGPFGGKYLIKLNKGDAYQVLGVISSGSEGVDLTGSYVKSISNGQGNCYPITVFSGSTRTGIGCGTSPGSSGDLIIQQIFPYQAWGTKFLTAPSSNDAGPNATSNMTNIYRVLVKDPTTIVKRNGVTLTGIVNNRYYQYESNTPDYIETNKPSLMAMYMSSGGNCSNTSGDGDPEMFYLSPLEQSIKSTQFYRNNLTAIDWNFVTFVIPNTGLSSLKIDGLSYLTYPIAERFVYPHSQPGYSVVTKRWLGTGAAGRGSSTITSDEPFTGIVYGLGSVESYGYNLGTLVKNLNNLSIVNNSLNSSATPTEYACKGSQFNVRILLPLVPDSIKWKFSQLPFLNPNTDSMVRNPGAGPIVTVNGVQFYSYTVNQTFRLDTAGLFRIPIEYWSPEIESCDKRRNGFAIVQVIPAPLTDFKINYPSLPAAACNGDNVTFAGDLVTLNGIALNQWNWTFAPSGSTPTGQNQTVNYPNAGVYDVKLRGITADGCVSDTIKKVTIYEKPTPTVVVPNIVTCPGTPIQAQVASPVTGVNYTWFNAAAGGTNLATGANYNIASAVIGANYFVEGNNNGCISNTRAQVTVSQLPLLTQPIATVTSRTANSITISWGAITGAISYEVSVNSGAFVAASGSLTHTITGLTPLQNINVVVRATATLSCQNSISANVNACTDYVPDVTLSNVQTCIGSNGSFTVNPIIAGVTYNWFNAATGGTSLAAGTTFNTPATNANYYVEGSTALCTSSSRKMVQLVALPILAVPVVDGDTTHPNILTWKWNAITGAVRYEISLDNGVTWATPSSGSTGLTHIITGQAPSTSRTLIVRAVGTLPCQTSQSLAVISRTVIDQIFIPNTFTPNGDGKNDVLRIYGYVIKEVHFMVFNQWGEKVFESRNQSIAWDGTYKGKPLPVGVYSYVCKLNLIDGKNSEMRGAISLIR